jgi:hypothetical protein
MLPQENCKSTALRKKKVTKLGEKLPFGYFLLGHLSIFIQISNAETYFLVII